MEEKIAEAVKIFVDRIEAEMPETGSFEPIIVEIENTDDRWVVDKFFLEHYI